MKRLQLILLLAIFSLSASALDVITLTDGSILKGLIINTAPNGDCTIRYREETPDTYPPTKSPK